MNAFCRTVLIPMIALLISQGCWAADWIFRSTSRIMEGSQIWSTSTVFEDGSVEDIRFDVQGRVVSQEKGQLPISRTDLLKRMAVETRRAKWKTRDICPGGQCSQDLETIHEVKGSNGQRFVVIRVDGIDAVIHFRDAASVRELLTLLKKDAEDRRAKESSDAVNND